MPVNPFLSARAGGYTNVIDSAYLGSMIKFLRWAMLCLSVFLVAVILEPWFVGRSYDPEQAYIGWFSVAIGVAAFPWFGGFVFGLTAGLWCNWLGEKLDRKTEQEAEEIGLEMRKLRTLFHSKERGWITADSKSLDAKDYIASGIGVLAKASKLGLAIPYPARFDDDETKIIAIDNYFRMVAPPLIAGDIKLAKSTAFAASRENFKEMQFP